VKALRKLRRRVADVVSGALARVLAWWVLGPFVVAALAGCTALASLLGPAAVPVATAAGAGLGAYEAQVAAAASARGLPTSDPRVLDAIAEARKLAEKRAAEDKARDEREARDVAALRAMLDASARACVPAPLVDAGAEGGR